MLTSMHVQYLVGLCCVRRNPDAVDVTVGDMVLDVAAEKARDVDITVTLVEDDGMIRAFKGYEVKKEGEPLDVVSVEQLCIKLKDMPTVTHRAIFSTSGFTSGAIAKANAHGVELYELKPWIKPLAEQFPHFANVGRPDQFLAKLTSNLLCWIGWRWHLHLDEGTPSFTFDNSSPLFSADGSAHKGFATLAAFREALLFRSTGFLLSLEPAQTIDRTFPAEPMVDHGDFEAGPAWPHTHTLSISDDQLFLKVDGNLHRINAVTISGKLQWQRRKKIPEFYILERVPDGEVYAGAAIAEWDRMTAGCLR
jgi:hypothetical protein